MPGKSYSRQFKLDCVRQVANGQKRTPKLCREHGLAESVLLRWRKEYDARGEAAFTEKQSPLPARRSWRLRKSRAEEILRQARP